MTKKLILLVSFFAAVHLFLIFLILYTLSHIYTKKEFLIRVNTKSISKAQFRAIPDTPETLGFSIGGEDARVRALNEFLSLYSSPLLQYAPLIVEVSDKYGLDYRLLPAIAMQESNLCKKIPEGSFNCWGYGIYGGKVIRFKSFEEGIETVAEALYKDYNAQGIVEPAKINERYASDEHWNKGVRFFIERLGNIL